MRPVKLGHSESLKTNQGQESLNPSRRHVSTTAFPLELPETVVLWDHRANCGETLASAGLGGIGTGGRASMRNSERTEWLSGVFRTGERCCPGSGPPYPCPEGFDGRHSLRCRPSPADSHSCYLEMS